MRKDVVWSFRRVTLLCAKGAVPDNVLTKRPNDQTTKRQIDKLTIPPKSNSVPKSSKPADQPTLILASASPRRRELLGVFGIDFDVRPADIDESVISGETPADYTLRLAVEKASEVSGSYRGCFVLGSDTTVALGGECLGKPEDADQARVMLERLSGTVHEVLSAVALVHPGGRVETRLSTTQVDFAELPSAWISNYIASGEPMDKAGAYGIQGAAGIWVRRLDGSYTGVVGLPLFETGQLLRRAGLC